MQLPAKFTNKSDPQSTYIMASNTDDFVRGERECLIAEICWGQALEQLTTEKESHKKAMKGRMHIQQIIGQETYRL